MAEKEGKNLEVVTYVIGIVSLVLAFFQPVAGIVLGIIGLHFDNKTKTELSRRGRMFSILGIVIGIIILIISLIFVYNLAQIPGLENFPA